MNFKYKTNENASEENKALHAIGHVNEKCKTYM